MIFLLPSCWILHWFSFLCVLLMLTCPSQVSVCSCSLLSSLFGPSSSYHLSTPGEWLPSLRVQLRCLSSAPETMNLFVFTCMCHRVSKTTRHSLPFCLACLPLIPISVKWVSFMSPRLESLKTPWIKLPMLMNPMVPSASESCAFHFHHFPGVHSTLPSLTTLDHRLVNFFLKELDNKYFGLCKSYCLCCNYLTLSLYSESSHR